MAKEAVLVSPHLDDAIFSAGGLLTNLLHQNYATTVITCFTKSIASPRGFALECQLDKGLAADVDYMYLRRQEDEKACLTLGCCPLWLPFAEAPHRGYSSASELFGNIRKEDAVALAIAQILIEKLEIIKPQLVCYPLGIGNHVDHQQIVRAMNLVKANYAAAQYIQWFDQPYLTRLPKEKFQELKSIQQFDLMDIFKDEGADSVFSLSLTPSHLRRKVEACLSYKSQIEFQFRGQGSIEQVLGAIEYFRKC